MSLTELTLILFVALILFGPEDLPVVARALGKIVLQARKYMNEITKEFKDAIDLPSSTINQAIQSTQAKPKSSKEEKDPEAINEELLSYDDANPLAELPSEIVSTPKQTQAGE